MNWRPSPRPKPSPKNPSGGTSSGSEPCGPPSGGPSSFCLNRTPDFLMGLAQATAHGGATPRLPSGPPYPCAHLQEWAGRTFDLPPGDARLSGLHAGAPADAPPLDNLVGAARYWDEHPDWMEFLDPNSPSHADKMVERALYLDFWGGVRVAKTNLSYVPVVPGQCLGQ